MTMRFIEMLLPGAFISMTGLPERDRRWPLLDRADALGGNR